MARVANNVGRTGQAKLFFFFLLSKKGWRRQTFIYKVEGAVAAKLLLIEYEGQKEPEF